MSVASSMIEKYQLNYVQGQVGYCNGFEETIQLENCGITDGVCL